MRRIPLALAAVLLCGSAVALSVPAQAAGTPEDTAIARALDAIKRNPEAVRTADGDRYEVWKANVTETGAAHVRFTRLFKGLPVTGGDFVVHLTPDGSFDGVSVSLEKPVAVDTTPKVTAEEAAAAAKEQLKAREVGEPQLLVDAAGGTGRLAWQLPVTLADGLAAATVDATEPRVLRALPDEHTATGTGHSVYSGTVSLSTSQSALLTYRTIDPLRGNSRTCDLNHAWSGTCSTFTDFNNVWGDGNPLTPQTAAVDVHYGAANAWDYFKYRHGRNGIFDNGTGVESRVHRGTEWVNASWSLSQKVMQYGDGVDDANPLVALDVVGHEMSHGVNQAEIPPDGMIYSGESGGLNETTSDIFGTMAEFYAANGNDPADYLIGEELDLFGNGTPLRYMNQPSLDGASADCYYNGVGNLGVHYSSGVGNHFFFLLAEGSGNTPYGSSTTCNNSSLVGIGRTKAAKIWYHALRHYFTAGETFKNARSDTLAATAELYGKCGTTYRSVARAWAAVGIGSALPIECLIIPVWDLVWEEWPRNPIPDPGPYKWLHKIQEKGTLETVEVGVQITHPRRGDLRISLVSPAGKEYLLKAENREDREADVTEVFPVRLGGVAEPGEWTLIVEDVVKGESGHVRGWSLLY
ncbi:peptidase M4 [Catellatospora sp. IY07-71]|uniref:M4 family metallopeptidase n=1 Tax=Catellatospora sp. IY07-71 TaxID=2728827 RepID=UPI001BB35196|nr:M4 family metallopeptidase [Catellatospora sp. IY07-71]BCJ74545.1 peptidase M4 [Catellatospora sp. IY07-71]